MVTPAPRGTPVTTCSFNDHGMTCRASGILSYSTNGSGPWYCREHWCRLNGIDNDGKRGNELPDKPVHSSAVEEIRAKLKRRA